MICSAPMPVKRHTQARQIPGLPASQDNSDRVWNPLRQHVAQRAGIERWRRMMLGGSARCDQSSPVLLNRARSFTQAGTVKSVSALVLNRSTLGITILKSRCAAIADAPVNTRRFRACVAAAV